MEKVEPINPKPASQANRRD